MIYENKVSLNFANKVKQISTKLKVNPNFLMMVIFKETGGSFSPSIKNPSSSASGLIQFMEDTAKSLGTTTAALRAMSATEQLDYVYKYLKPFTGRLKTFRDVYLAVFYPSGIGRSSSWKFPSWVYKSNRGIDMNKDGVLTLGEFEKWAMKGQDKLVDEIYEHPILTGLLSLSLIVIIYSLIK